MGDSEESNRKKEKSWGKTWNRGLKKVALNGLFGPVNYYQRFGGSSNPAITMGDYRIEI